MAPDETRNAGALRLHLSLAAWFTTTLFLLLQIVSIESSLFNLALQLSILVVAGVVTLGMAFERGFWSPACLFILVVSLFHAGLTPYILFGLDPMFPRADDYGWFYGQVGQRSLALVGLFVSAFVLAAIIAALLARPSRPQPHGVVTEQLKPERWGLAHFGALSLLAGMLYWFYVTYSVGGLGIFFGSYMSFLDLTSGSNLSIAYMMIGIGLGLAVLGFEWALVRISLYLFIVFGFFAFFLGLRGEVLFPLAVAASVLAFRVRLPRGIVVVSSMILVLSLINGAKNIRTSGLAGDPVDVSAFSPMGALAELGSSLRVVAHTVIWHEQQGDPFRGGDTYTVSVTRLLESLFSPFGSPQASSDFRLMNSEVMERSGAIGGSVVAESFHNFGLSGVFVAAILAGMIFGLLSVQRFSVESVAVYVCLAVPLFNHIRNSFVPVLPFILISGCIVLFVYILSRTRPILGGPASRILPSLMKD